MRYIPSLNACRFEIKWLWKRLCWQTGELYWKIRHRTVNRFHVVDTGLKPDYYDKDIILLHACFNLLVDFVEVECAAVQGATKLPNPEEGVKRLQEKAKFLWWQGKSAQEALCLYYWWKNIRPMRNEDDFTMEDVYYRKDTEMLVRLVKLRGFMWT